MSIEQKKLILNCPKVTFSEKGKAKLLLSEQLCKLEDTVSIEVYKYDARLRTTDIYDLE